MDSGLAKPIPGAPRNAPLPRIGRGAGTCGLALLLVGLATALTALLWPHNRYAPFSLYYPAVLLATRLVNRWAGFFAAILAILVSDYLFLSPRYSLVLTPDGVVGVVEFAAVAVVSVLLYDRCQRTKDARQMGEERLRLAMAGARLGSWHWDLRRGELVWSDQCRALFGLPPGTALSSALSYERFLAALHPQDRAGVDAAVRHALHAHTDYDVEYRTVRPDGTLHWLSAKGRGYYDAKGHPSRMEGVVVDISERKRVSEVVAPLYDQIGPGLDRAFAGERVSYELRVPGPPPGSAGERFYTVTYEPPVQDSSTPPRVVVMVTEITERKRMEAMHLENLRLESENRRIQEVDRLKSEFLANMSHELRTPLNAIMGFTEVLSDEQPGPLNPQQKDYLAEVLNSARHLLALINDVLDLAKVEADKIELHAEPIALGPTLEAACALWRPLADQKGIGLELEVAPELGEVTLDLQKLKQICYNLLSNAVKFTNRGGRVVLNALARGEGCFELRVKDTGIGIKPEDLPRLFRSFEQLEAGASRRFEGTGLGLALTKKLVELQAGRIEVESQYGQGSTLSVVLPRCLTKS